MLTTNEFKKIVNLPSFVVDSSTLNRVAVGNSDGTYDGVFGTNDNKRRTIKCPGLVPKFETGGCQGNAHLNFVKIKIIQIK